MPTNSWITVYQRLGGGEVRHLYHTTSWERATWRFGQLRAQGVNCGMQPWKGVWPFVEIEREEVEEPKKEVA